MCVRVRDRDATVAVAVAVVQCQRLTQKLSKVASHGWQVD
jgi:hypothetical protein